MCTSCLGEHQAVALGVKLSNIILKIFLGGFVFCESMFIVSYLLS